jgi:hypothetical protein
MDSVKSVKNIRNPAKCISKRFGIRVACIFLGFNGSELLVLFQRKTQTKEWTLVNEVPDLQESLDETSERIFKSYFPDEQTSVHQVQAFGDLHHDKRRWITIVYWGIVNVRTDQQKKSTADTEWFSIQRRPLLSAAKEKMLRAAIQALQKKVRTEPIGLYLLPPEFTLPQLQKTYEQLLGHPLSKMNFRKKMWESEILIPLEKTVKEGGRSQPKGLYRFNKKIYHELKRKGFFLDL